MGLEEGSGTDPFSDSETGAIEASDETADEPTGGETLVGENDTSLDDTAGGATVEHQELTLEAVRNADPQVIAQCLAPEGYHASGAADQSVAVVTWRDTVSTGRDTTKTFDLQSQLIEFEREAAQAVNEELDADVPLTDIRELALAFAYSRPEVLAGMAEEWGLQF